ncbi:MAG: GNAT family N-acetyltransferase [Actinomycetota bacterium]|nr:GNAT family N-acetyltransferase [Actinomycetota bacterium]
MIRPASSEDAAAVSALELACLGADAWSATLVAEAVSGSLPTVSVLVATVPGASGPAAPDGVVGYAVLSVAGEAAELQRIAVAPEHRRTQVGRRLLEEAARQARRTAVNRLLLEVREDNGVARSFYAALGFVEIDRRQGYYRNGGAAVVMGRPL